MPSNHVQASVSKTPVPPKQDDDDHAPVAATAPPKSKRRLDSDVIEMDLSGFRKDHTSATDTALIDEFFHSNSHLSGIDEDETRFLDQEHALSAVDELFNRWEFTVTPE